MQQQINFYRSEYRTIRQEFSSGMLLATCGAIVVAMFAVYGFSMYKALGIDRELKIVTDQEQAAIVRLENFQPNMDAGGGDQSWEQQLEEARRSLRDQQLVLGMVADSSLGDTQGFSHHLTSLARQDTEGLWLTYIRLSSLGDNTQLEGLALRADLVPAYLQRLAEEPPFATQRFTQFQIERRRRRQPRNIFDEQRRNSAGRRGGFAVSEKSPILKAYKALQAKIDKMDLRERLLVFTTGLMLVGSIWYMGLMEPLNKQIKNNRTEITAVQQRIDSINQNLEIQARAAPGGSIGYQEQFALIQRRLDDLNEQLGGYTAELIGPGEMARVLQGMLREQANLRLIRMANLAPEALSMNKDADAIFYKHGLEFEFEGGYFACLEYLKEIEALPWRFYWQILELEVLEYPQNRIRLEISTLSPHEEWIGA